MSNLSLEELRALYQREWDRTQRLEDKAKNVISTAGTFTSLIFGFVTLSSSLFKFGFPSHLAITIGVSIIASILAILVSVLALRVHKYTAIFDPVTLKSFSGQLQQEKLQQEKDKQLQQEKDYRLTRDVINNYIKGIWCNHRVNDKKATKVNYASWLLFSSIVLIGIATGMTLSLFQGKPAGPVLTIPDGASIPGHISYEPDQVTVSKEDTIRVQNKDSFIHTVTSGKGLNDTNTGKLFDTDIIKPGESADVIIANLMPGKYPFFCAVHPYMTGILKVIELRIVSAIHNDDTNREYNFKIPSAMSTRLSAELQ